MAAKKKRASKKTTAKKKVARAAPKVARKAIRKVANKVVRKPARTGAPKASSKKRVVSRAAQSVAAPKTAPVSIPPPAPSDRALAVAGARPKERAVTDEERTAMENCSSIAQRYLDAEGTPEDVVRRIAIYVDDVRTGRVPEPKSQDLRIGIGVLWGEQVRAQVGWRWVHLAYPDGFASYGLVPDDRAFACFPLNRIPEMMAARGTMTDTTALLFQRIRSGELPGRGENAYLVIG